MTTDEIRDRLAHIIVEKLNSGVVIEEVRWESNLRDDLGIDSLAAAELVMLVITICSASWMLKRSSSWNMIGPVIFPLSFATVLRQRKVHGDSPTFVRIAELLGAEIRRGDGQRSRVLVLCMSAHALGSDWAHLEAGTFRFRDPLNQERRFIPLRLDDAPIKGPMRSQLPVQRTNSGDSRCAF